MTRLPTFQRYWPVSEYVPINTLIHSSVETSTSLLSRTAAFHLPGNGLPRNFRRLPQRFTELSHLCVSSLQQVLPNCLDIHFSLARTIFAFQVSDVTCILRMQGVAALMLATEPWARAETAG